MNEHDPAMSEDELRRVVDAAYQDLTRKIEQAVADREALRAKVRAAIYVATGLRDDADTMMLHWMPLSAHTFWDKAADAVMELLDKEESDRSD